MSLVRLCLRALVVALAVAGACAAGGCTRHSPSALPPKGPLCAHVTAHELDDRRWSVEMPADGPVAAAHEARFTRLGITPNGEAWAGVLEQCAGPLDREIDLDPEAGSLHAWVASDAAKDRLVTAMCRAVDDHAWLDRCLASIDRSKLDD